MNLQALQLLKQAETFIDSQSWKFYMSSWKHTPIFIRKNRYFCHVLRLKKSKIASKCTLWSTNTCTGFHFTYSESRKWIKRILHSMWGPKFKVVSVRATKSTFYRVRRQCFFPKAGVISQRRETGFLFLTVKLIKMTLSPHQSLVSAVRLASKYPSLTPETSLWQISADVHKTGPHFHSLNIFCINSFLNRPF